MTERIVIDRAHRMRDALDAHHAADPADAELTVEAQLIAAIAHLERTRGPVETLRIVDTVGDYLIKESYRPGPGEAA